MRADTADVPELNDRGQEQSFLYDAFISYDHDDRPVAHGIQRGLHRIGRRVGRLHALRVFRDSTDLSASPDLWGKVTEAMDRSRYMIAVLSPHAVASAWVNKEVAYWLEHRGAGPADVRRGRRSASPGTRTRDGLTRTARMLRYRCSPSPACWRPSRCMSTSAMTPRGTPPHALFREKVTDLAAPIHGKPKYELASEDLREQRRFRRLRRVAIAGLVLLTVVALAAALVAINQTAGRDARRQEAIHQRNEAVALALATASRDAVHGNGAGPRARGRERSGNTHPVVAGHPRISACPHRVQPANRAADREPLTGHTGEVSSAASAPTARRWPPPATDGTMRLWDMPTRQPIGDPLTGHTTPGVRGGVQPRRRHAGLRRLRRLRLRRHRAAVGPPLGRGRGLCACRTVCDPSPSPVLRAIWLGAEMPTCGLNPSPQ